MKKTAKWKVREEKMNDFNAIVVDYVDNGNVSGYLDTIATGGSYDTAKFVDTSQYIFITTSIVSVSEKDLLEINDIEYRVNHVDNPLFADNHLEIELEVN